MIGTETTAQDFRFSALLYGEPGTGKTTLATQIGLALSGRVTILAIDDGALAGRAASVFATPHLATVAAVSKTVAELRRADPADIGTVVVDSIGAAYALCVAEISEASGITDGGKMNQHRWTAVNTRVGNLMRQILALKTHVVFTSLAREVFVDVNGTPVLDSITSSFGPSARNMIHSLPSNVWCISVDNAGQRMLTLDRHNRMDAKTRLPLGRTVVDVFTKASRPIKPDCSGALEVVAKLKELHACQT